MRPAKPISVYAVAHTGAHNVDIETQTTAMIKFDSGVTAEIDVGCMSHISRPRWLIRGDKGAFTMPDWNTALLHTADGETRIDVQPSNWPAIYQNVADHLTKGKPLDVTATDVRTAMQVIDAAFTSANTGEVAKIEGTN